MWMLKYAYSGEVSVIDYRMHLEDALRTILVKLHICCAY